MARMLCMPCRVFMLWCASRRISPRILTMPASVAVPKALRRSPTASVWTVAGRQPYGHGGRPLPIYEKKAAAARTAVSDFRSPAVAERPLLEAALAEATFRDEPVRVSTSVTSSRATSLESSGNQSAKVLRGDVDYALGGGGGGLLDVGNHGKQGRWPGLLVLAAAIPDKVL